MARITSAEGIVMTTPKWQIEGQYYENCNCDFEGNGARGLSPGSPPLQLAHTGHPAADTFSLARASNSDLAAFGLSWDDTSGRNNAQYAPFVWRSA